MDNSRVARSKRSIGRPALKRSKLGVWVDEHGWSRQRLADELGIAFGTATRLCSGARRPSLETAIQIEDPAPFRSRVSPTRLEFSTVAGR